MNQELMTVISQNLIIFVSKYLIGETKKNDRVNNVVFIS